MLLVNLAVPILTEEYFQMLGEETVMNGTGLDEKYAPHVAGATSRMD